MNQRDREDPKVDENEKEKIVKLASNNPSLALEIIATIKMINRNPTVGDLTVIPDGRYYPDDQGRFRISYITRPTHIEVRCIYIRSWNQFQNH